MRKLERILWSIAGIGLLLKVLHLPFAGLLTVLSFSLLAILYFCLGWLLLPMPTRKDQILGLSIFGGFSMATLVQGLLFKVQLWPGAAFQTLIGLYLVGIVIVLAFAMRGGRPRLRSYFNGLLRRAMPLFAAGLLMYPVGEGDILRFHHRNDPYKAALVDSLERTTDPAKRAAILDSLYDRRERAVE